MFFLIVVAPCLITIIVVSLIAWFIKKKSWTSKKKKFVFSSMSTFLLFPNIMPAATLAWLPMPNAALFFGTVIDFSLLIYLQITLEGWKFTLPSFLLTWVVMHGISQMIFFEYKPPKKI